MSDDKKPTPIRPRDTSHDAEFRPLVSFEGREDACAECEGREFVRGFEAGLLHARLEAQPPEFHGTYHSDNLVVLGRIAKALGYDSDFTPTGVDGWMFAAFTKAQPKRRLAIVQP